MAISSNNFSITDPSGNTQAKILNISPTGTEAGLITRPILTGSGIGTIDANITQIGGAAITLGQKTMANSFPVVIASDQSVLSTNLTQVGGASITLGQKTSANSVPVVLPSDQIVDTNLTQVGGSSLTLGQKVSADSVPVVLPSDQVVNVEFVSNNLDAFSRLKVSTPFNVFDSKQIHDNEPLIWDNYTQNGATSTFDGTNSRTLMQVAAVANSIAIRQTKMRFDYKPGKSLTTFMTFYAPSETNIVKRVGHFSGDTSSPYLAPRNGVYFENNAGTLSFNIAKNGTVTETATQASWNLDKLDGTGASGVTLNMNGPQILVIDLQWLGVGVVRVGFDIDGVLIYVHQFAHSNNPSFTTVYMQNPNLPLRYTIHNTAAAASTSGLSHICTAVIIDEGALDAGKNFSVDSGATAVALPVGNAVALIGIRIKSTYTGAIINPANFIVMPSSSNTVRMALIFNPTIAGVFTYTGLTNSAIEYAIGDATNTITAATGTTILSTYAVQNNAVPPDPKNTLRLGRTIAGVADQLILAGERVGGATSVFSALTWRETL